MVFHLFTAFYRVENTTPEPKPLFQLIQNLINKLSNGQQVMEEVNQIQFMWEGGGLYYLLISLY